MDIIINNIFLNIVLELSCFKEILSTYFQEIKFNGF